MLELKENLDEHKNVQKKFKRHQIEIFFDNHRREKHLVTFIEMSLFSFLSKQIEMSMTDKVSKQFEWVFIFTIGFIFA